MGSHEFQVSRNVVKPESKENDVVSTPTNPGREHPSTYFVQDRSSEEELTRLMTQDQMITLGMGGALPEQPDPTIFQRVLDVGCGPGGWLIEAAKTYPGMSRLVGVDVSSRIVEYARAQAAAEGLSDRIEFHTMDALRRLDFPSAFFDLVNQRAGGSYLRTWDWPKLLSEFQRVSRPGGVVRITEGNIIEGTSPALTRLNDLLMEAFCRAGHFFTKDRTGLTSELAHTLQKSGLQNVQTHSYVLEFRSGSSEGLLFYEDMKRAFRTLLPFLRKWSHVPDDYEEIYQHMLSEMQQPDFVAIWQLLTAWGKVPLRKL